MSSGSARSQGPLNSLPAATRLASKYSKYSYASGGSVEAPVSMDRSHGSCSSRAGRSKNCTRRSARLPDINPCGTSMLHRIFPACLSGLVYIAHISRGAQMYSPYIKHWVSRLRLCRIGGWRSCPTYLRALIFEIGNAKIDILLASH